MIIVCLLFRKLLPFPQFSFHLLFKLCHIHIFSPNFLICRNKCKTEKLAPKLKTLMKPENVRCQSATVFFPLGKLFKLWRKKFSYPLCVGSRRRRRRQGINLHNRKLVLVSTRGKLISTPFLKCHHGLYNFLPESYL